MLELQPTLTGWLPKQLCHPEFISGSSPRNIIPSPENIKNIPFAFHTAQRRVSGDYVPQKESETMWLPKQLCHPELVSGSYYRHITTPPENINNITSASRTVQRKVRGGCATPRKAAFTLAEVLITLGIIGVVAAMTLPVLTANYRKSVVETRLAKFYSVINQAIMQSEVENGSRMYWKSMEVRTQDDVVAVEGISPEEWYGTYLKKYVKTLKTEESGTVERRFDVYFTDGSMVSFSGSGWNFFPYAKDYEILEKEAGSGTTFLDINRTLGGTKSFSFLFEPYNKENKYLYKKGVEPYSLKSWDGTRESLFTHPDIGCNKNVTNTAAYCTMLIFMNGWKIPKDYPFKL